eukprot:scaffold10269_cov102-Isochrysis_galbana.AAC.4
MALPAASREARAGPPPVSTKPVHTGGQPSTSASKALSAASWTAIALRLPAASVAVAGAVRSRTSIASPPAACTRIRKPIALSGAMSSSAWSSARAAAALTNGAPPSSPNNASGAPASASPTAAASADAARPCSRRVRLAASSAAAASALATGTLMGARLALREPRAVSSATLLRAPAAERSTSCAHGPASTIGPLASETLSAGIAPPPQKRSRRRSSSASRKSGAAKAQSSVASRIRSAAALAACAAAVSAMASDSLRRDCSARRSCVPFAVSSRSRARAASRAVRLGRCSSPPWLAVATMRCRRCTRAAPPAASETLG